LAAHVAAADYEPLWIALDHAVQHAGQRWAGDDLLLPGLHRQGSDECAVAHPLRCRQGQGRRDERRGVGRRRPHRGTRRPARKRRPLSENENARLLKTAQERPLIETLTIRTGKNKGKPLANVGDALRQRLEHAGRERALVYKFMILTGLRRNEMSTLTVGSLCLDADNPFCFVSYYILLDQDA
jgi:hypothetical protein